MGKNYFDNSVAVQGRYANVVSLPQQQSARNVNSANVDETTANAASVKVHNEPALEQERKAWTDEKKAKFDEIINDEEKMDSITETLNKFMAEVNADLRFSLHKETNFLMVKFVDVKNNKVLKEFPPEEYLDIIANIREYIGAMIDKKV